MKIKLILESENQKFITMKNRIFLLTVLASFLVITGCEKIKNLADVEFDADYSADIDVTIAPDEKSALKATQNYTFNESETIDPNSNSDFDKYADKIKDVEVKSVTAEVISINKEVTLTATTLEIFSDNHSASWYFEEKVVNVGTSLSLQQDDAKLTAMEKIIDEREPFTVSVRGESSKDDVQMTIRVTVKTKITANPLD